MRKKRVSDRTKVLLFTKNTCISTGYPHAIKENSGYFKEAKVVAAIGGKITLVFLPSMEKFDTINIYLTAADAYELGKLLMERAEVASKELLEIELEKERR